MIVSTSKWAQRKVVLARTLVSAQATIISAAQNQIDRMTYNSAFSMDGHAL